MSERPQSPSRRRWPAGLRWAGCFVLVVGLHATAVAALMNHWRAKDEPVANGPVVLVDLAPIDAAPAKPPNDVAPPPKPVVAKPKPEPKPESKPAPKPAVQPAPKPEKAEMIERRPEPAKPVVAKPQPKPAEKLPEPEKPAVTADLKPPVEKIAPTLTPVPPPPQTHPVMKNVTVPPPRPTRQIRKEVQKQKRRQRMAMRTPEPSHTSRRAPRAVAPRAGAATHDPNAVPRWKTALVMRLQRYKRYPAAAQERGVQGVARLAFSVDRRGRVHHARIVRSSGSSLLDRATMQLIARAQPLPPPPPEVHGATISIVVPIRYNLH